MRFTLEVFSLPEVANDNYVAQFEAVKKLLFFSAAQFLARRTFCIQFSLKIRSFPIVSKLPIAYHVLSFTETYLIVPLNLPRAQPHEEKSEN